MRIRNGYTCSDTESLLKRIATEVNEGTNSVGGGVKGKPLPDADGNNLRSRV